MPASNHLPPITGHARAALQEVLSEVPAEVDTLIFPNYESLPEREDVADPFTEVGGQTAGGARGFFLAWGLLRAGECWKRRERKGGGRWREVRKKRG